MSKIDIQDFLKLRNHLPVIDVRSPGEYQKAHIPGAYNIPLFSDEERAHVGIAYQHTGRIAAVKEGLKIIGPKMRDLVEWAEEIAGERKKLIVHCWRGGMRSENMAWLFSRVGIDSFILIGGYKSYRRYCRKQLDKPVSLIVLGGYTGSGKTEILHLMSYQGEQCLDLEGLANHKGSVFGSFGECAQLPNEHFENLLFEKWLSFDLNKPIWVEDESKMIGKNCLPDALYHKMRTAPVIKIEIDKNIRLQRLVQEYARFDKQLLKNSIQMIGKRLGGQNAKKAIEALDNNDYYTAADITLRYYDKAYQHGLDKRKHAPVYPISLDRDAPGENAAFIVREAYRLLKTDKTALL
ncbi:MAG: tRNA 2-selenouridine(34) synthase MnmH [Bacteroidales bacterium]